MNMAELLTRDELDRTIEELKQLRLKMTAATNLCCVKCMTLYVEGDSRRNICYCDFESDRY